MTFQTPLVYQSSIGEDGTSLARGTVYSVPEVFHVDGGRPVPWSDVIKRPESRMNILKKSESTEMMQNMMELLKPNLWDENIRLKMLG